MAQEPNWFRGEVYDLDYLRDLDWVQVLIRDGFVGSVDDVRLQRLLEAAMWRGLPVTVRYEGENPHRILAVSVESDPGSDPPPPGRHAVEQLRLDDAGGRLSARFRDHDGEMSEGYSEDPRMESLLARALGRDWPIAELVLDERSAAIARGKLNLEDR